MSDDEYEIPLQDQRVFGAGLKRKRVHFVPSTAQQSATAPPSPAASSVSVGDRYLRLVLSKSSVSDRSNSAPPSTSPSGLEHVPDKTSSLAKCEICSLPLPADFKSSHPHEASLAHQVCLQHSHPPSHIDRSRIGLRYLQSQGWDPDSRKGLGAQGQGIQFPIKAKPKDDKMGLGLVFPAQKNGRGSVVLKKETRQRLDAGKVRKLEEKDRRKRERLQEMFYRSEHLDRYLGTG
jgi:hypothetical protein